MDTGEQVGKENNEVSKGVTPGGNWLAILSLVFGAVALAFAVGMVRSGEYGAVAVGCGLIGTAAAILYIGRNKKSGVVAGVGIWLSVVGMFLAVIVGSSRGVETDVGNFIGRAAPDFTVVDMDGNMLQLSKLRGRRVVLDFWGTYCPPCRIEVPFFVELTNTYSPDDLVIVGIGQEDERLVRAFAREFGINYRLVNRFSELPIPYRNVGVLPTTVFIDRKGIVQSVLVGLHDFKTLRAHATARDYEAK